MQIPVADAHCDFLYYAFTRGFDIGRVQNDQIMSIDRMKAGGVALQFFAAWTDRDKRLQSQFSYMQQLDAMIDKYEQMHEKYSDELVKFSASNDSDGRIATVLAVEGADAIASADDVDYLFNRGVRAMTLTWNFKNSLAYPSTHFRRNQGLSSLGKKIVKRMNAVGIAIDVAHLNDGGIDDVLALSNVPVFASHSNCRSVFNSPRSLQDVHIEAIAKKGGVIGINFFYKQLGGSGEAHVSDILPHIEHVIHVGGINSVCIGSDFDGMNIYPPELKTSADFPILVEAMSRRGYSDEQLCKIFYSNLKDYISRFCL